ncbi:MAG: NAD(P)/FAD-dependent oxidoreductase [Paracoccaceae bacterium]
MERPDVLVVGAGPAGLMAAQTAADRGARVLVAEAMPSPARKFLMAGKSGLNLTKMEGEAAFLGAYPALPPALQAALDGFGPAAVRDWVEGLGQETVVGSTGRLFPVAWKASPLLRAWLSRLERAGVTLRRRWRWAGFDGGGSNFETPEGPVRVAPRATVLAMGGASWPRLGSDGAWAAHLPAAPFAPANAGVAIDWSAPMARLAGTPIKGVAWRAGALTSRGEAVVTREGLEGGGIYAIFAALRDGAPGTVDLLPDLSSADLEARIARLPRRASGGQRLRRIGLPPVLRALAMEVARPLPEPLSAHLKALPLPPLRPMGLSRAISSAGGVRFADVSERLTLRSDPSVAVAGEMLDWEAPTGGYLITACLATGRVAGDSAAEWAESGGTAP